MTAHEWTLFALLWLATLLSFRSDPAWELVLEAAIFLLAAATLRQPARERHSHLPWGLAAIALLGILQIALGGTLSPSATALAAVRWMALAAACLCAERVRPVSRTLFLEKSAYAAGALALLSLAMWATSQGRVYWLWSTRRADVLGPWVNPNHFAVWCELLLAPAVWLAMRRRRFWWVVIALLAGGAASGSRAGLVLIGMELMLLVWLGALDRWSRVKLSFVALAFPALALLLGGEPLWQKVRAGEPLLYRDQLWHSSWTLWRQQPWWGHGLGTFSLAYPSVADFDTGELVDHAHNDWLELGAEGGAVAVGLLLAGSLYTSRRCWSTPWLLGVPVAGLHALVDYPFARFSLALWALLLVSLASQARAYFPAKPRSVSRVTVPAESPQKRHAKPAWNPTPLRENALD